MTDLHTLTDDELVRYVTTKESVTELENELAHRLEALLDATEPEPFPTWVRELIEPDEPLPDFLKGS